MNTPAKWARTGRWGLYRDTQRGWIAGVCAGIAERLGIHPLWVRLVLLGLSLADRIAPSIVLYVVLTIIMERRPRIVAGVQAGAGYLADRLQARLDLPMPGGLNEVGARFALLDAKLARIEAAVMSDDLSLRRKFRDIGG